MRVDERHRWHVQLTGDPIDLGALAAMFTAPDLRVMRNGDEYFLESAVFETRATSAEVHQDARGLLPLLNGTAKVSRPNFRAVAVGTVVLESDAGTERRHQVLSLPTLEVRVDLPPATILVDGQSPERPEAGSLATDRWVKLAVDDPDVAEALRIFDGPQNWVNLYKIHEIVRRRADIAGSGWATDTELKLFTWTANHPEAGGESARHARSGTQPPPDPMTLEQAVGLVRRILTGWLGSLA